MEETHSAPHNHQPPHTTAPGTTAHRTLSHPLRNVTSMEEVRVAGAGAVPLVGEDDLTGQRPADDRAVEVRVDDCAGGVRVDGAALGHALATGLSATGAPPVRALALLEDDPAVLGAEGLGEFLGSVRAVRAWIDAREAAALAVAARCDAAGKAGAADTAA